jgi:hypothetical protein
MTSRLSRAEFESFEKGGADYFYRVVRPARVAAHFRAMADALAVIDEMGTDAAGDACPVCDVLVGIARAALPDSWGEK